VSEAMDEIVTSASEGVDKAAGLFAPVLARLPGDAKVSAARIAVLDDFLKTGLPHRRIEAWKYTDLRAKLKKLAPQADAPGEAALAQARAGLEALGGEGAPIDLVIVDGHFIAALSSPIEQTGIRLLTLGDVLRDDHNQARDDLLHSAVDDPMVALNAAMAGDGVIICVPEGFALARPIRLVHVSTQAQTSIFARSFLRLAKGASAKIIETTIAGEAGAYQGFDTLVTWLGEDARLDHLRIVREADDATRISSGLVTLGAGANFHLFNLTHAGATARYQGFVRFSGEGARADIHGAALLAGRQHADTSLFLDHDAPDCYAREHYHAVLEDEARSVFQGKIVVRAEAQKTDAKMMARALLLSDAAEADHKPELEIYADDVQCGHGATTGALDESLLFYLRARGLAQREAQAMLIRAFVGEAIEKIGDEMLRDIAFAAADHWLERRA